MFKEINRTQPPFYPEAYNFIILPSSVACSVVWVDFLSVI